MIKARIFAIEAVEDGADQEYAAALEGLLVDRHGHFDAARDADAAGLANAADDRPAVDAAQSANAPFGGAVGKIGEHRNGLAQGLRVAPGAALDEAEMIEAQQIDEAPGDFARIGRFAAAAQLSDDRLARARRSGDAMKVDRRIVDEAKISAALSDRQELGQVAIGAERGDAELSHLTVFVDAGAVDERDKHVGSNIIRRR